MKVSSVPKIFIVDIHRYSFPLDETTRKKYSLFGKVTENYTLGFSKDWGLKRKNEFGQFYLVPHHLPRLLRQTLFMVSIVIIGLYLALIRDVKIMLSTTPIEGFSLALVKLFLRFLGRKIVIIIQAQGDWEEVPFLVGSFPRYGKQFLISISDFAIKEADLVRAVSRSTRQMLEARTDKPCIVYHTFTDVEAFKNSAASTPANESKQVLYAGALTYLKGVHVLLEAMKGVMFLEKDAELIIAGEGEYRQKLEEIAAQLRIKEKVKFVGWLSQSRLSELIRQCFVFVLPSFSEGLGRVIIEALISGKPVIASNIGGLPEIIRDGEYGFLVQPDDPQELSQKILYLLRNPDQARKMGREGKEFAEQNFSNENYAKHYQKMIDLSLELLNKRSDSYRKTGEKNL
ncbi:MAG: glycosyltransferase [Candidatus Aminicenantes bacterium]|nr:glycosyltransferase [Candidatus Aminicenantes bacterium]